MGGRERQSIGLGEELPEELDGGQEAGEIIPAERTTRYARTQLAGDGLQ